MSANLFGKGPASHGNIPMSLHEMDPLVGSARQLALDQVGVPDDEVTAAFVLLDRLHRAGRGKEVLTALLATSFVHEITPLVNSALPAESLGGRVNESLAVVSALTSEVGLIACDPGVPHSNPVQIESGHDRWHAIGHPAAGSMLVAEQGLPPAVATIVGNRHRHGPDVAHGTGGLSRELRSTSDVSAASQDLAGFYLQGAPETEADLTARAVRRLFDDPGVYGTRGSELADAVCERFELPPNSNDPTTLPTLGVGVIETSGGLMHVAIRPDMGDSIILLPFHGDHFDHISEVQERVFGNIVSRAMG